MELITFVGIILALIGIFASGAVETNEEMGVMID